MSKILLIEPDTVLAKVYARALESVGHEVNLAAGAQAAVHTADRYAPDLVVMEVQLARHNGVEFLYEFRSYPEWQNVPVLLHTLVPPAEFTENTVLWGELGIAGYLYKPRTSLRQLLRAVAAYDPEHETA